MIFLAGPLGLDRSLFASGLNCAVGKSGEPADTYVPMDSWVYSAMARLHALGYADTAFLGVRPWTRRSIERMLDEIGDEEDVKSDSQAGEIVTSLKREFGSDEAPLATGGELFYGCEQLYSRLQGIGGLTLRDSYHLGQTIANDYGRPYEPGFNTVDGAAGSAEFGRFSLYVRGEYQHAPSAAGYSPALAATLANLDAMITPYPPPNTMSQPTIPAGPVGQTDALRIVEANLSYRILNHEISFGKSDHWLAPTVGGAFAYSNNAENIYAFQIDRIEPLYIPLLSRLVGPFRYDFFVGSLKGHASPRDPWMHVEKINFKPTPNVEFGFERTVIWGGKGRPCQVPPPSNAAPSTPPTYVLCDEPITLHTFLKSFFSTANTTDALKYSRDDPGARFASFDFSWRLPWLNHWLTLYTDSIVHDDISPIDAPRHAGVRPGLYLARLPGLPRLDARFEGANTNNDSGRSYNGQYMYAERAQPEGYTNKGYIMGDWIGRESQGGQMWLTYHLSPMEMVQASFKHAKAAGDFIPGPGSVLGPTPGTWQNNAANPNAFLPGGTTQNSFDVHVVKRLKKELELSAEVQYEWWKAPIYQTGQRNDTVATFQLTLYPERVPQTR